MLCAFAVDHERGCFMDVNDFPDSVRDMLVREREAVLTRMQHLANDVLSSELENDGLPASSSWGSEQAIADSLELRLNTIESALERLDEGSYGVCADCGADIPPGRLKALPFATLCVSCQSVFDRRSRVLAS
jgi:DnaK suppressor protein